MKQGVAISKLANNYESSTVRKTRGCILFANIMHVAGLPPSLAKSLQKASHLTVTTLFFSWF